MSILTELSEALIQGKLNEIKNLAQQALDEGYNPKEIIDKGLIAGMDVVGAKFKKNEVYVPEVLIAAKTMHNALEVVKPHLVEDESETKAKILIGTVKGDLHDIGKNLVVMMLEGAGFEVKDLGVDVSPEKFVEAAKEYKPQVIGMSALLTTTMLTMKETLEEIEEAGLRGNIKIMIGGAPVTQKFADEIGADGFALNASEAVDVARKLIS
ncbi:MAG: corrinoid protein [Bacillota bacterium]|nr:corrinoid protein [Bacillota bacterium]